MKVLFINPGIEKDTQHPLLNSVIFSSPPLGLGYIAAFLRQQHKGVNFKVIDEASGVINEKRLSKELADSGGRLIVGISCMTATYSRAIKIAEKIKSKTPDALIIFGGVHVTAFPEEALGTGFVDLVVRQEGEITMSEIYGSLVEGKDIYAIRGISYIRNGKIYHNPNRELADLSILPAFPFDLFEDKIDCYSDFGFVLTSRGCPFDCIFCSNRLITGRAYRVFDIGYVIDQIRLLARKYGQKSILFGDDNLVADKKRFFKLINALIEERLHKVVSFNTQIRAEDMTEDVLDLLKKANFRMIACGIETASERLLSFIHKKQTVEQVKRGVKLANAKGLLTGATFIFGFPGETDSDRKKTFQLSRELPLSSARFNIATPYPGTKLFEIAKEEGRLYTAPLWRNFNVQYYVFGDDIPYFPEGTGKYALMFYTMWANIRFYLSLKILLSTLIRKNLTGGNVISQNRKNQFTFYCNVGRIVMLITVRFIYLGLKSLQERFKLPAEAV